MSERKDLRRDFQRRGYVVASGLIPENALKAIASDISGMMVRRARSLGLEVPIGADRRSMTEQVVALFEYDPAVYMASAKASQHLVSVHQLGVGTEILSVLSKVGISDPILSTRPVIHYMMDRLKIEGGYHKTPAHQDWRSVQGSVDGVTIWLPLFDVGENDYALEIIPDSQRGGLRPSADHAFGHCVAEGAVDESQFRIVTLNRGDAMFFSGFLVHRTCERGGDLVRIALSYRFNNAAEPTFVNRNYPDRYLYKADKELLFPEFPSRSDIEKVFPSD